MTPEVPITEEALYGWIIADPERWLGDPMKLRRPPGRGSVPDLVGLDQEGRPVVVEVKEETLWESPSNRKLQHVTQLRGYVEAAADDPTRFGLPTTGRAVRAFAVGQLVDAPAQEQCRGYGIDWREVIDLVPGAARPFGHPKSTQWMRQGTHGGAMVRLMEEFPGATRDDLAVMLQALKCRGLAGGGDSLETCRRNVAFWTGFCRERWYYVEITPEEAFSGASPMLKEGFHLAEPNGETVTLVWADGTPRKTQFPDAWVGALASLL